MLLVQQLHCGCVPEDMPPLSRNWLLLVYAGQKRLVARYKKQGEGLGVWEYNDSCCRVAEGDFWLEIPENAPAQLKEWQKLVKKKG